MFENYCLNISNSAGPKLFQSFKSILVYLFGHIDDVDPGLYENGPYPMFRSGQFLWLKT